MLGAELAQDTRKTRALLWHPTKAVSTHAPLVQMLCSPHSEVMQRPPLGPGSDQAHKGSNRWPHLAAANHPFPGGTHHISYCCSAASSSLLWAVTLCYTCREFGACLSYRHSTPSSNAQSTALQTIKACPAKGAELQYVTRKNPPRLTGRSAWRP